MCVCMCVMLSPPNAVVVIFCLPFAEARKLNIKNLQNKNWNIFISFNRSQSNKNTCTRNEGIKIGGGRIFNPYSPVLIAGPFLSHMKMDETGIVSGEINNNNEKCSGKKKINGKVSIFFSLSFLCCSFLLETMNSTEMLECKRFFLLFFLLFCNAPVFILSGRSDHIVLFRSTTRMAGRRMAFVLLFIFIFVVCCCCPYNIVLLCCLSEIFMPLIFPFFVNY